MVALIFFTPLFLGSVYQAATVGFSPINILGVIALLGMVGAVNRLRDDRREQRSM